MVWNWCTKKFHIRERVITNGFFQNNVRHLRKEWEKEYNEAVRSSFILHALRIWFFFKEFLVKNYLLVNLVNSGSCCVDHSEAHDSCLFTIHKTCFLNCTIISLMYCSTISLKHSLYVYPVHHVKERHANHAGLTTCKSLLQRYIITLPISQLCFSSFIQLMMTLFSKTYSVYQEQLSRACSLHKAYRLL